MNEDRIRERALVIYAEGGPRAEGARQYGAALAYKQGEREGRAAGGAGCWLHQYALDTAAAWADAYAVEIIEGELRRC